VDHAVRRWRGTPLHQRFAINGDRLRPDEPADVVFQLFDAGHVLGAVGVQIEAEGRKLFYTGDVNFEDQTISRGARFPEEDIDVLVMETTRGDSPALEGFTRKKEEARLAQALKEAFNRGGCVLIPVFALGKTQELLAMFYEFRRQRLLANIPIYIGGLSTKLTEIYDRFAHTAPRQKPDLQILDQVAPFVIAGKSGGETQLQRSRIYALSSGMMTENTLSHTFAKRILSNPQHSLFFVGHADPISPAGKIRATPPGEAVVLKEGEDPIPIKCTIEKFNFSGHSTRESLRAYVNRLRPKKVVLVHGDPKAIEWFRATLAADLPDSEIVIPPPGVPVEL
jgi:Cft2 family RNA processing exonuclease